MTLDEPTAAEAGRRVRNLVDAISEDAGSPPRLCDLLDVLAVSVPGLGEGLEALPDRLPVDIVLRRGRRHRCTEDLAVREVGDHVFVNAVHFLSW